MVGVEKSTLDECVRDSQEERVVVTRNGSPVAVVVGVEGLDEEQVQLGCSDDFWKLIIERRRQNTLSRAELEGKCDDTD
jgi:PHD/YefM family antitoxin component YafN of YafNO toxin-antitoxin module